ncbi:single-strand DNA endonuclease 1 isoform X1 [Rhodamnia argentea]|uniref:Single-strand DNA endonuclease 1 n=1 Tax=Rhodamnia argentea TaxID=178133 RepID=A0A8B8PPE0_9MYRT|nr:single-strand DNA endonuclease 1 isoform X1 [Rhodamnia argentea]
MGVKNLWDILESCKKTIPLHHLQNKRMCIDLSCWMVQLQNVSKYHNCMKEKVYLKGLFHRLRALIALNCSLIFVTDGSIPAIKLSTYRRRLNSGIEVNRDETNLQNLASLKRNMGSEFSRMIKEAKVLGMALGIPCLDGMEEAEAQCALLNSESHCDGCFTSDSDVFLFGAKTVYRDICLGDGGYVICYEMKDIERQLGFGRNSLIALALLLGSDYSHGVRGFGPESACQIVKSAGDNGVLQKIAYGGLPILKKTKGSKKQQKLHEPNDKENSLPNEFDVNGSKHKSQGNEQFLQVIDAYIRPKCHSADSEAVYRVLANHPFQRIKFQEVCAEMFEWPPEKTDEYILPKIAERDLRRFAKLRSTSSELGVELPLYEIPVKCPVSGIIKQRKLLGVECFEVSWEHLDGLETSIVPADLLESACPEKILEFKAKIAQQKKQKCHKPRPRKLKSELSLAELDLKLQQLLLEINSENGSNPKTNPLSSRAVTSENGRVAIAVDLLDDESLVDQELDIESSCNASMPSSSANTSVAEKEVIDLLSPSPRHPTVTKFKHFGCQHIDVIDLSESDAEASPEHDRKARELRQFIANVRK